VGKSCFQILRSGKRGKEKREGGARCRNAEKDGARLGDVTKKRGLKIWGIEGTGVTVPSLRQPIQHMVTKKKKGRVGRAGGGEQGSGNLWFSQMQKNIGKKNKKADIIGGCATLKKEVLPKTKSPVRGEEDRRGGDGFAEQVK